MHSYTANNGRAMQVGDEAYEKASNVAMVPCLGNHPNKRKKKISNLPNKQTKAYLCTYLHTYIHIHTYAQLHSK